MKNKGRKGVPLFMGFVLAISMTFMALGQGAPAAPASQDTVITVLHTNDVHGAVMSDGGKAGLDYVAGLKDSLESQGKNPILVDAGDYSQGTPFVSVSQGSTAIRIMNAVGYDAVALGNHEFDYNMDVVRRNVRNAAFPILNANIDDSADVAGLRDLPPCRVIEKAGVRVGIFALDTPETYELSGPAKMRGLTFADPKAKAVEQSDFLRHTENCDVVIGIGHLGDSASFRNKGISSADVAKACADAGAPLDLFVDGHDHVQRMGAPGQYSDSNKGADIQSGAAIVSTGTELDFVGKVTITVSPDKSRVQVVSEGIPNAELKAGYAPKPEVTAIADQVNRELEPVFGRVVGKTKIGLYGGTPICRRAQSSMASLVADANRYHTMRWVSGAGYEAYRSLPVVGFVGGGGVRASVPAGDITMKDVVTVLPFGGETRYLKMSYAALWEMVENGVSEISVNTAETDTAQTGELVGSAGRFFQPSGFSYVYDPTKPASDSAAKTMGSRVQSITLDGGAQVTKDDHDQYVLIMTGSYEVEGGDGYYMCDPAFWSAKGMDDVTILGSDTSNDNFLVEYLSYLMAQPENADGICVLSETGRIRAVNTGYTAASYDAVALVEGAAPGSHVTVSVDGEPCGEALVNSEGQVEVKGLSNGGHDLRITADNGWYGAAYVSDYCGMRFVTITLKAPAASWPVIYQMNRDTLKNPNVLRAGQKLRVPAA